MAFIVPKCSGVFAAASNYSYINPFPNCTNPNGFDLDDMRNVTLAVASSCISDPRLFQSTVMLTNSACQAFANGNGWRRHKAKEVWGRIVSWKLPLFQLVALFQRPPLSVCAEFFAIVHLMGDPISTLQNLLVKFENCHDQAVDWHDFFNPLQARSGQLPLYDQASSLARHKEIWRAFAATPDAYEEFSQHMRKRAVWLIKDRLSAIFPRLKLTTLITCRNKGPLEAQDEFLQICLGTGNALAADRTTKFLPMFVAQVSLIFNIVISFVHAKGEAQKPDGNINVDGTFVD